jgi:hypothetical protein
MADEVTKSLNVSVKANLDPSGFEQGSSRVIASAEHQATALQNLRKSTEELQRLQGAYKSVPEVYAQGRTRAEQNFGKRSQQYAMWSPEAEKLKAAQLQHQIKMAGGLPPDLQLPEEQETETREISTVRLREMVNEKFSQFGGMSKSQRKTLLGETQPHIQELQRRYGAVQQEMASRVRETTAEFEALPGSEQEKHLDSFNTKIQMFERNLHDARVASDELAKSTRKVSEEAGLASKSLPAYAASVINMGVTIGSGIAHIARAGALAFDYSSPMGMYSAQQQFEIQRRSMIWGTGGAVAGQIVGAAMGGFPGSYIGGLIGGGAGDIISTFLNIQPEQRLKMMGQMYGKSAEMVNQVTGVQGAEYSLARRSGVSPEEMRRLLKAYGEGEFAKGANGRYSFVPGKNNLGISQQEMAPIVNQFVSTTGENPTEKTLADWMDFYSRTNILPSGMMERFTGKSSTGSMALTAQQMGINEKNGNLARIENVNQMYQSSANIAGRLFTNAEDIRRATSMTAGLGYTLYGSNISNPETKNWATSFEGMQQTAQGFGALGQAKNGGEQALLFNALNVKGDWKETLLRMQEGIYGKGNLQNILSYVKTAYGGRAGDALFSILSDKGVNPSIIREMVKSIGTKEGYAGLVGRLEEKQPSSPEELQKLMDEMAGRKISPLAQKNAAGAINVTEQAREFADAFTTGIQAFNVEVAKIASSEKTQTEIQGMYDTVIKSVNEALKMPGTKSADIETRVEGANNQVKEGGGSLFKPISFKTKISHGATETWEETKPKTPIVSKNPQTIMSTKDTIVPSVKQEEKEWTKIRQESTKPVLTIAPVITEKPIKTKNSTAPIQATILSKEQPTTAPIQPMTFPKSNTTYTPKQEEAKPIKSKAVKDIDVKVPTIKEKPIIPAQSLPANSKKSNQKEESMNYYKQHMEAVETPLGKANVRVDTTTTVTILSIQPTVKSQTRSVKPN